MRKYSEEKVENAQAIVIAFIHIVIISGVAVVATLYPYYFFTGLLFVISFVLGSVVAKSFYILYRNQKDNEQ